MKSKPTTTDFGFETIPANEKTQRVYDVFERVAPRYDLMNDLMSLGMHRLWKKYFVSLTQLRTGQSALDVAGGTGDIARKLYDRVGKTGSVVLSDINHAMLSEGQNRCIDLGYLHHFHIIQADATSMPFASNHFDCITLSFGLRNMTDKLAVLKELHRILKPGGQLLVLEFSKPVLKWLEQLYDRYSFSVIPQLGEWVSGDRASYEYLVESIRRHPDQETLKKLFMEAHFEGCTFHNLSGGIVAIHRGYKS